MSKDDDRPLVSEPEDKEDVPFSWLQQSASHIIEMLGENLSNAEEWEFGKSKTSEREEDIVVPYAPGKAPKNTENFDSKSATNQVVANDAQHNKMVSMIKYMNKVNGPNKSIDAEENARLIEQKYGDKAYDVLYKAIMEPTNYQKALDAKNAAKKAEKEAKKAEKERSAEKKTQSAIYNQDNESQTVNDAGQEISALRLFKNKTR